MSDTLVIALFFHIDIGIIVNDQKCVVVRIEAKELYADIGKAVYFVESLNGTIVGIVFYDAGTVRSINDIAHLGHGITGVIA
jgi:hypothetical protein